MLSRALHALALLLLLMPCAATAERIPRGKYRGTYRIDRWQQPRFGFLFVQPGLHDQLKEHAGQPLLIDVTNMRQPVNPGGAMIAEVGDVERQDTFVEVDLQWIQPKGDGKHLRRVQPHDSLELRLEVRNRSPAELDLSKCLVQLALNHRAPGDDDRLGFRSHREQISELWLGELADATGKPSLLTEFVISEASFLLRGTDERIGRRPGDFTAGTSREAPKLPVGKAVSWSITVDGLPANEYELVASVGKHIDRHSRIEVESAPLLLDVLQTKPGNIDGVEVDLTLRTAAADDAGIAVKATLTLTNPGDFTRILYLPGEGGEVFLGDRILCFDSEGRRILTAARRGLRYERILIEPKRSLGIEVSLPAKTKSARLVWYGGVSDKRDKLLPDAKALRPGYFLSPHVVLD